LSGEIWSLHNPSLIFSLEQILVGLLLRQRCTFNIEFFTGNFFVSGNNLKIIQGIDRKYSSEHERAGLILDGQEKVKPNTNK
jgi:hypothetical protein